VLGVNSQSWPKSVEKVSQSGWSAIRKLKLAIRKLKDDRISGNLMHA
jgi:hypothetical protein